MSKVVAGCGWMGVPVPVAGYPGLRRFGTYHVTRPARALLARRVANAKRLVAEWLERCERPYVALSGGKDSCVTLHLVRSLDSSVPAVYGEDEDGTFPDVQDVIRWWQDQGVTVDRFLWESWPRLYAEYGLDSEIPARRFGRQFDEFTASYDGAACGYRSQENDRRAMHHRTHGHLFYQERLKRWRIDPIWDWSVDDVWAYIALHELPYAALYDLDDGQPRASRRVGSPFGTASMTHGRIVRLKRYYPEWFQRFVSICPEARRYT